MEKIERNPMFRPIISLLLPLLLLTVVFPIGELHAQRSSEFSGMIQGSRRYPNPRVYEDVRPPSIELISPGECVIVEENDPLIIIGYRDPFSGVDLSTLDVRIDDVDYTASFTVGSNEASYQVPSLPGLSDGEHEIVVTISDTRGNTQRETYLFGVDTAPGGEPIILGCSGFIDGVVYDASTEEPMIGAKVTVTGVDGEVQTDSTGRYVFPVPRSGEWEITIEKADYTLVQRKIKSVKTRDVAPNAAYLTPFDAVKTKIKSDGGTHFNSTNEIRVYFPPGAVSDSIEVQSTKYQKGKHLPGRLPETSFFTYALDLQPDGTTFDSPVTVSLKNALGFPPGAQIPVGIWNDQTLEWEDTGIMAVVGANGDWVNFQVEHFSPYDVNTPAPPPPTTCTPSNNTPETEDECLTCAKDSLGSLIILRRGEMKMDHQLPSIRSLGTIHAPRFVYKSLTANPSATISVETDLSLSPSDSLPETTTFRVSVEGITEEATYEGVTGSVRYAYMFEGKNARDEWLETGSYPYVLDISNNYDNMTYWSADSFGGLPIENTGVPTVEPVPSTRTITGRLIINNQQNSAFGSGWSLAGLQRLHFDPDGEILLTEGDGTAITFRARETKPIYDIAVTNDGSDDVSTLLGYGDGRFTGNERFDVEFFPSSIKSGDFNSDGRRDLVVTSYYYNDLAILLGRGDGTFEMGERYGVGSDPLSVAVGDFNNDGVEDLAVANSLSDDISVLLGIGDGTFSVETRFDAGTRCYAIAVDDFNGDNDADLVVANYTSNDVSVLLGRGDGTFQAQQRYGAGNGCFSISIGDFDGDDIRDLAVANYWDYDVSILLGLGDGSFVARDTCSLALAPTSIAIGDFDDDNDEDLAVTIVDNRVTILLGNGDGTFETGSNHDVGDSPYEIVVGDFDGDGSEDLAMANQYSHDVSILLGQGAGTFAPEERFHAGGRPQSLTIDDFDGDGEEDLAVANYWSDDVSILAGYGDGTFADDDRVDVGEGPSSVAVGDFNNDGNGDLAVANYIGEDISILLGRGNGGFRDGGTYDANYNPRSIVTGDFDSDGNADLAATKYSIDKVMILMGDGDGTFTLLQNFNVGDGPYDVAVGDFDTDGNEDLVVANDRGDDISVLMGHGDGTFAVEIRYDVGTDPRSVAVGDLNGDGREDLAVANFNGDYLSVLMGNGDGTFRNEDQYSNFSGVSSVTIGELNGDGIDDLVLTSYYLNKVYVLLGQETGTLAIPASDDLEGGHPVSIDIGDMNGDMIEDLVVACEATDDISILLGLGDGVYGEEIMYDVGVVPSSVAIGDFNRDYFEENYFAREGDYTILRVNPDESYTRVLKNGTEIHFNEEGYHTSTVDRYGNTTVYGYNDDGNLTTVTDPTGGVYAFSYDGSGHLGSVTDPAGRVTLFTVDANGDLVEIVNPDSSIVGFGYDDRHLLTRKINERGDTTIYAYDAYGRIDQGVAPTDETRQYYPSDVYELVNDLIDPVGTPDDPAPVVRPDSVWSVMIDGKGSEWRYQTNKYGGRLAFVDPLGRTTRYERDEDGNQTVLIRPNGSRVEMTYDAMGNLLTSTEDSTGATTAYTYAPVFNQVISIRDPLFNLTEMVYDSTGNLVRTINAMGDTTRMSYDDRGLVTGMVNPLGNITRFAYDPATGNLDSIINPLGDVTTFEYDDAGNVLAVVDPMDNRIDYEYDSMNRVVHVINAEGDTTFFGYDAAGHLASVIDARRDTTTFTYNTIGKLSRIVNPLGDSVLYAYDLNRNLESVTDYNGRVITYEYSAANQLTRKDLPNSEVVTFSYNSLGLMETAVDDDSDLEFVYDAIGRLTESKTLSGGIQPVTTISYTYDKNNNRLTMTNPQGGVTDYGYDVLNRLVRLDNSLGQETGFEYDALSRDTVITRSNGVGTTFRYDDMGNLASLLHGPPGVTYDYRFNAAGMCTTTVETVGDHIYTYDSIYQLIHAIHPDSPDETYTYDPVGNRTSQGGFFDKANRLIEDDDFLYDYDGNGNLVEVVAKLTSDTTRYTYDPENHLVRIDFPGGGYAGYRYDALGRRIEMDVDGTITRYVYEGEDILCEYDGSNTLVARYTHGPGIDRPISMARGGQSYFYHADRLGSIRFLTDASGIIVQTYQYDAFGNIVAETGSVENPYTFTGREYDSESGLYYYRARYYDPQVGRFISEDPIGFMGGGFNLYTYVLNNPNNYFDPFGLESECCNREVGYQNILKPTGRVRNHTDMSLSAFLQLYAWNILRVYPILMGYPSLEWSNKTLIVGAFLVDEEWAMYECVVEICLDTLVSKVTEDCHKFSGTEYWINLSKTILKIKLNSGLSNR